MLNKIPTWLLICLPAVLFWLGWTPNLFFITLFVAFVPLFELEKRSHKRNVWLYFGKLFLSLLLWNISLTWWVWNSTAAGAVTMLILNSLFMCFPWLLYRFIHKKTNGNSIYLFIILWMLYEYLHHRWDLSWPWLTLGNGLAGVPWLVQWYDITGTLGGTAFVLGINVLLFGYFIKPTTKKLFLPVGIFLFFLASSFFNQWKFNAYFNSKKESADVVIMQSNFDPWNEKFVRSPFDILQEMENISAEKLDSNAELLIWPETSLTAGIDADHTEIDASLQMLKRFRKKYPKLNILSGADMEKYYRGCRQKPTITARKTDNPGDWWDAFNSAVFITDKEKVQYYHKSILVPGTEQMPFVQTFPIIERMAIAMDKNSISGSLGKADSHTVFRSGKLRVAPAICYEGIYGDHVGQFVNQGANLIAIITNDAWWGNTPIYTQHLFYGRLRAIEHRKWVVRSANSGISCFIDPDGKIVNAANKFGKTAIRQKVYLNNYRTLYAKLGDLWVLVLLSVTCLGIWFFQRKNRELFE